LAGVRARISKKIWDTPSLFISATVEASNFGIQLGLVEELAKKNFYDQNWRGSGIGKHPKNWGLLFISATVEASNFKFGIDVRSPV